MKFELQDINMISENNRLIPSKNRWVLNPKYRDYKQLLIDYFLLQNNAETITGEFTAKLTISTYKDLTNLLKPIFDALEKAEVIKNDRFLLALDLKKFPIRKGNPDSFVLELEDYENAPV